MLLEAWLSLPQLSLLDGEYRHEELGHGEGKTSARSCQLMSATTLPAMKIAVVGGSGNVGSRLARQLCLSGNNVVLASRNPQETKVSSDGDGVSAL